MKSRFKEKIRQIWQYLFVRQYYYIDGEISVTSEDRLVPVQITGNSNDDFLYYNSASVELQVLPFYHIVIKRNDEIEIKISISSFLYDSFLPISGHNVSVYCMKYRWESNYYLADGERSVIVI